MPFSITAESGFSSAHRLPDHQGKCRNLHGHNWRVRATVQAETLDPQGMVMDFADLKKRLRDLCDRLDHLYLNDIPPFDSLPPTAENISRWLYQELSAGLPDERVTVSVVSVWETESNLCEFRP